MYKTVKSPKNLPVKICHLNKVYISVEILGRKWGEMGERVGVESGEGRGVESGGREWG